MRHYKEVMTIIIVAVFGASTLLGTVLLEQKEKKQDQPLMVLADKLADDVKQLKKDEPKFIKSKLNSDIENLKTDANDIAKKSRDLNQNTSTPIKVRGGSMTVFTDKAWDPDSGGFCTEMEKRPPSIDFDGDTYNVTDDNWETQIFGTSPDKHTEPNATSPLNRFDASPRGIKLKGKAGPCPQGNGTYHVNLTFVGNDSSSYPNSLAPHPKKHKNANIRFMDSSEQCKGDPVVILGPHDPLGKGDRELCERMRQIKFISGITSATQPLTRDCIDGDCELSIGAPIP